jgi:hypothetical protein
MGKEETKVEEVVEVKDKPQVCVFVSDGVYKYVDADSVENK